MKDERRKETTIPYWFGAVFFAFMMISLACADVRYPSTLMIPMLGFGVMLCGCAAGIAGERKGWIPVVTGLGILILCNPVNHYFMAHGIIGSIVFVWVLIVMLIAGAMLIWFITDRKCGQKAWIEQWTELDRLEREQREEEEQKAQHMEELKQELRKAGVNEEELDQYAEDMYLEEQYAARRRNMGKTTVMIEEPLVKVGKPQRAILKTKIIDTFTDSRASTGSAVGRAIVGNLLAGPVGAVVGASTAKDKITRETMFMVFYTDGTREHKTVRNGSRQYEEYMKYLEL